MRTINGKLIIREQKQLEILQEQTKEIIQRCDSLESQFTAMNKQQNTKYLQETSTIKSCTQKLDNRLTCLEQNISKRVKSLLLSLLFINISATVGFFSSWFWLHINHQQKFHDVKPEKITKSTQLYRYEKY